jgi:hypothetical protein
MQNYPLMLSNKPNQAPSSGHGEPTDPVGIRRSTISALRLKTGVKAGYLGNNPNNQGRNHSSFP